MPARCPASKESINARIAKARYPQQTVLDAPQEAVLLSDGEFVLCIGNPPFGSHRPELLGLSIHTQSPILCWLITPDLLEHLPPGSDGFDPPR